MVPKPTKKTQAVWDRLVQNKSLVPRFDYKRKCWRVNGKILKGAHNILERWYWQATGGRSPPLQPTTRTAQQTNKPPAKRWKSKAHTGLENGKRIGRDLAKFVKSGKIPSSTSSASRHLHRHSRRFLAAIKQWGYRVYAVEMPVAHIAAGVGTGVDVVLQHVHTGRWKACELKCGFVGVWEVPSGARLPFSIKGGLPDTHRNRAMVQLLLTHSLLMATLSAGGLRSSPFTNPANWEDPCVVLVNDQATTPFPVDLQQPQHKTILDNIHARLQASADR